MRGFGCFERRRDVHNRQSPRQNGQRLSRHIQKWAGPIPSHPKSHNHCDEVLLDIVVPVERIELPTFGLQNRCSTAELNRLRY
jgi:hypothetical protein